MSKLVQLGSNVRQASEAIATIEATGFICAGIAWNGGSYTGLFNEAVWTEKEVIPEEPIEVAAPAAVEVPVPPKGKRQKKE